MDNQTKVISTTIEASFNLDGKKDKKKLSTNSIRFIESFKALVYALLIGVILIIITGQANLLVDFFEGFWVKNFSTMGLFTDYLATLTYLIPLGLALAVSFRMGLFNIGAAGQAIAGGTFAFVVGSKINIGSFGWIVTICSGVAFAMLVGFIIAFLRNRFKINEVISSIMINWVIFYLVMFIVTPTSPVPDPINILPYNDLRLDVVYSLFGENVSSRMNVGIILVFPIAIILWWAYSKTNWGYKQEVMGNNRNVGAYLGINYKKEIYKTMILSSALAGLAGVIYYCGYDTNLMHKSASELPAWSFNGITIALLGFNSPIGVIFASGLFAMFNPVIDASIGSIGILNIVVASMIFFIAMSNYRITYGKKKLFSLKRGGN